MSSSPRPSEPNQSPVTHLYRFRPIDRLLGDKSKPEENHELERQYIYFSPFADLNDPMEGFTDFVWQGDTVVWENLLRHYVICLGRAIGLLGLIGEDEENKICWGYIPIVTSDEPSLTPQQKSVQDEILSLFFSDEILRSCIGLLANRERPVRRHELCAYLGSIHFFAVSCICEVFARYGVQVLNPSSISGSKEKHRNILSQVAKQLELINQVERSHPNSERATDALFASRRVIESQMRLINQYNGIINASLDNRNFVFLTFHEEYIKEIERLVFPPWYTACFIDNYHDASVWGHYGMGHKGVCLKFRVDTGGQIPSLNLTMINGVSNVGLTSHKVRRQFDKVGYTKDYPVVDFFKSIFLPIPALRQHWYSDRDGNQSAEGIARLRSPEASFRRHWKDFYRIATSKLKAYKNEREYRLILSGGDIDYSISAEMRKATYDFADVEGVIFGMNTPHKDKLEIMRIVEDKCRKENRTDFKFYQAYYSPEKGEIDVLDMGLLKLRT